MVAIDHVSHWPKPKVDPDLLMTLLPSPDQVERPKCFATMDNSSDSDVNNFPGFDHETLILPTVVIGAKDSEHTKPAPLSFVDSFCKMRFFVSRVWKSIRKLIRLAKP